MTGSSADSAFDADVACSSARSGNSAHRTWDVDPNIQLPRVLREMAGGLAIPRRDVSVRGGSRCWRAIAALGRVGARR
jgi:hypothetical protein